MQNPAKLYLIKDFVDQKIVLYWAPETGDPVSPNFTSLTSAHEWWLMHNFASYSGQERRSSIVERRRLHTQRTKEDRSHHIPSAKPDGRRETDIEVQVDKDISQVKMLQFYSRNPHLLDGSDD